MVPPADDLPRQLLGISRDFEPRLLRELHQRGHDGLRPSYARFLYLLWDRPRPLSEIAEELGISRQAASQAARRIEAVGYAERRPNPVDARSKLVAITSRGRAVERADEAIEKCHAHYEAIVGERLMRSFVESLALLRDALGVQPVSARASLGVLPLVALETRDDIVGRLVAKGHHHLPPSHLEVLVLVGRDGARPADVARRQGVSRQSAGSTLRELERLGRLGRAGADGDQRAVVFLPTSAGGRLLDDHDEVVHTVETRFRRALGGRRFADLHAAARELSRSLELAPGLDLEEMARRLRQRLSATDAGRLAALLAEP